MDGDGEPQSECPGCQRLSVEMKKLQQQIDALQKALEESRRAGKRQAVRSANPKSPGHSKPTALQRLSLFDRLIAVRMRELTVFHCPPPPSRLGTAWSYETDFSTSTYPPQIGQMIAPLSAVVINAWLFTSSEKPLDRC